MAQPSKVQPVLSQIRDYRHECKLANLAHARSVLSICLPLIIIDEYSMPIWTNLSYLATSLLDAHVADLTFMNISLVYLGAWIH